VATSLPPVDPVLQPLVAPALTRKYKSHTFDFSLLPPAPADELRLLPEDERLARMALLSEEELTFIQYDWAFWARPSQRMPDPLTMPNVSRGPTG
jgi:hypothetical protein